MQNNEAHRRRLGIAHQQELNYSPTGTIALDARAMISATRRIGKGAYPHLVISPYPEKYITPAKTFDGRKLSLRPIRPEDEPLWIEMLNSCSPESIRMRFFSLISDFTHEMAVRYCVNDYDRELALVAETEHEGRRKLVGVARLVADPNHHTAEFAVIIPDAWHNRGVGAALTDVCMQVAKDWGLRRVTAYTLPENTRMIKIFRDRRFKVERTLEGDAVFASKNITARRRLKGT